MENNKHIYFSIDSDVLRALTFLDIILKEDPKADVKKCKDPILKNYGGYLKKLLELAKNDAVRLLIVNTVYQESKHSENLVNFMKEYCYFPNVNFTNFDEKSEKIERLVDKYCTSYSVGDATYDAPFMKTYNASLKRKVAPNDAYIVAESTIENACLITNNSKHIIYNERNDNDQNSRVKGIVSINISEGYYQTVEDGVSILTPRPYALHVIGPLFKKIEEFSGVKTNDNKVKADTILR